MAIVELELRHSVSTSESTHTATRENSRNCADINKIELNNSAHIQLGSSVIYNGPVTISNSISNTESRSLSCCCFKISRKTLKRVLTSMTIVLVLILLFALVLVSFFLSNARDNRSESPLSRIKLKAPPKLGLHEFYAREDWNASHVEPYVQLIHPIRRVIITHTVARECYTETECMRIMQEMQKMHLLWDFGDIGFNFVIMNDGSIFEGRGWDTIGAHTVGYNNNSIGIAFNGDFRTHVPPLRQVLAGFALLNDGVRMGKLSADFRVYGMRQFQSNESPGEAFYQMIKTWDQWSENINECCPSD